MCVSNLSLSCLRQLCLHQACVDVPGLDLVATGGIPWLQCLHWCPGFFRCSQWEAGILSHIIQAWNKTRWVWGSPFPSQVFLPQSFRILIIMTSEISRLKEGHRLLISVWLCDTLGFIPGSSKPLARTLLWRHLEAGVCLIWNHRRPPLENEMLISFYCSYPTYYKWLPWSPLPVFQEGKHSLPYLLVRGIQGWCMHCDSHKVLAKHLSCHLP